MTKIKEYKKMKIYMAKREMVNLSYTISLLPINVCLCERNINILLFINKQEHILNRI